MIFQKFALAMGVRGVLDCRDGEQCRPIQLNFQTWHSEIFEQSSMHPMYILVSYFAILVAIVLYLSTVWYTVLQVESISAESSAGRSFHERLWSKLRLTRINI